MGQINIGHQILGDTPSTGNINLYPKSNDNLYLKNSNGDEERIAFASEIIGGFTATSDAGANAGQVAYVKTNGNLDKCSGGEKPIGLFKNDVIGGNVVELVFDGILTLTDWFNVIGATNLQTGTTYYLDQLNSGKLTNITPSGFGQFITKIGKAVSPTKLKIDIKQPIKLN